MVFLSWGSEKDLPWLCQCLFWKGNTGFTINVRLAVLEVAGKLLQKLKYVQVPGMGFCSSETHCSYRHKTLHFGFVWRTHISALRGPLYVQVWAQTALMRIYKLTLEKKKKKAFQFYVVFFFRSCDFLQHLEEFLSKLQSSADLALLQQAYTAGGELLGPARRPWHWAKCRECSAGCTVQPCLPSACQDGQRELLRACLWPGFKRLESSWILL